MPCIDVNVQDLNRYVGELRNTKRMLQKNHYALSFIQFTKITCGCGEEKVQEVLRRVTDSLEENQNSVNSLKNALNSIGRLYESTEQEIKRAGKFVKNGSYLDGNCKTFDDDDSNGSYGGDQGNMKYKRRGVDLLFFHIGEDDELYDFIKQYDQYSNYSDKEIGKLLDKINSEGCGYVAFVNAIFVEYEGREQEFEQTFGFPMYDENGKPNYDYLLVDFYTNTDNKFFMDNSYGESALVNRVIIEYDDNEAGFREKYGCDRYTEDGQINPVARQKILDEYQGQTEVTLEGSGVTGYEIENRVDNYLNDKGVDFHSEVIITEGAMDVNEIDVYLDADKNVAIGVGDFNLYDDKGNIMSKDVGGHMMTITGVTEDGRYIVSSWGDKYYINPDELTGTCQYYIIDVEP